MPDTVIVSVAPKDAKNSARRKEVQHLLSGSGRKDFTCKGVFALYKLEGPLTPPQIDRIIRELLADPIVETFHINQEPESSRVLFADVWYKRGVADPAADSVLKAVADLGISSLKSASCGTRFVFGGKGSPLEFASKELLNPLIQECSIHQR